MFCFVEVKSAVENGFLHFFHFFHLFNPSFISLGVRNLHEHFLRCFHGLKFNFTSRKLQDFVVSLVKSIFFFTTILGCGCTTGGNDFLCEVSDLFHGDYQNITDGKPDISSGSAFFHWKNTVSVQHLALQNISTTAASISWKSQASTVCQIPNIIPVPRVISKIVNLGQQICKKQIFFIKTLFSKFLFESEYSALEGGSQLCMLPRVGC